MKQRKPWGLYVLAVAASAALFALAFCGCKTTWGWGPKYPGGTNDVLVHEGTNGTPIPAHTHEGSK
jgi:hypothetical protein